MSDMSDLLNSVPPLPWTIVEGGFRTAPRIRAADGKTVVFSMRSREIAELIVTAVNFAGIVNSTETG